MKIVCVFGDIWIVGVVRDRFVVEKFLVLILSCNFCCVLLNWMIVLGNEVSGMKFFVLICMMIFVGVEIVRLCSVLDWMKKFLFCWIIRKLFVCELFNMIFV